MSGWALLPLPPHSIPHSPPSCWPVRRGRTPASKLLLFIHRLCLLKSLPSGALLPPICPVTSFWFPDSLRPAASGTGCGVAGLESWGGPPSLAWPLRGEPLSLVQKGPGIPSKRAPRDRVWSGRLGLAEGTRVCVFHKCLARWWVRRVTCFCGEHCGIWPWGLRGCFQPQFPPALAPGSGFAPPHHPQPLEKTYSRRTSAAGVGEEGPRGGAPRALLGKHLSARAVYQAPQQMDMI